MTNYKDTEVQVGSQTYLVSGLDVKLIVAGQVRPLRDALTRQPCGQNIRIYREANQLVWEFPGMTTRTPVKTILNPVTN